MGPAGLDHADFRLGEVVDDLHDPHGRGDEVCVEDGDELAARGAETFVERAGLEAVAVGAVDVKDGLRRHAFEAGGVALDDLTGDFHGFVGGVVEELDLEAVAGVIELAAGLDEAFDDELLVIAGELDGDEGEVGPRRSGLRAHAIWRRSSCS